MAKDKTIGLVIKRERQKLGLTQRELAVKIGVSSSTVSYWEVCKNYPSEETLEKIAILFDRDLEGMIAEAKTLSLPEIEFSDYRQFVSGNFRNARENSTRNWESEVGETYRHFETGVSFPTLVSCDKFSKIYGVESFEFLSLKSGEVLVDHRIIGERVMTIRKRKGWSKKTLAQQSGIAYITVERVESGRNFPSVKTLLKLAIALDTSLFSLVGKENDSVGTLEKL